MNRCVEKGEYCGEVLVAPCLWSAPVVLLEGGRWGPSMPEGESEVDQVRPVVWSNEACCLIKWGLLSGRAVWQEVQGPSGRSMALTDGECGCWCGCLMDGEMLQGPRLSHTALACEQEYWITRISGCLLAEGSSWTSRGINFNSNPFLFLKSEIIDYLSKHFKVW